MIITAFLNVFLSILQFVMSPFALVTTLPFSMDAFVIGAAADFYAFTTVFWPLTPVLYCLAFYIPIKIGLLFGRLFLGNRLPD